MASPSPEAEDKNSMAHLFGYAGRLLRVDLTRGQATIEPSAPYVEDYLGGRGLAQQLLFHEIDPPTGPFDRRNKLILSAGPLVGTIVPASARLNVDHVNAHTCGVGSSNVGGHFAPELKFAGFDAVVIEGESPRPVYLYVANGQAQLHDAGHLWGLSTGETEAALRQTLKEPFLRVASIGPAGENRVTAACLIVDGARAAGRSGAGAVLGAKGLKAIGVRGTLPIRIFDLRGLLSAVGECNTRLERSRAVRQLRTGGTHGSYDVGTENGSKRQSVRNGLDEYWPPEKYAQIREEALRRYEIRHLSCFNCPIYCSHLYRLPQNVYRASIAEGCRQMQCGRSARTWMLRQRSQSS